VGKTLETAKHAKSSNCRKADETEHLCHGKKGCYLSHVCRELELIVAENASNWLPFTCNDMPSQLLFLVSYSGEVELCTHMADLATYKVGMAFGRGG